MCTGAGCGRPIRWVLTVGGKRMPLDPDPAPDGNVVRTVVEGSVRARVLTGDELPAQDPAWVPHHRTCPAAAQFRRNRARAVKRCRGCTDPLDPVLAAAGDLYHPLCAPTDLREQVERARAAVRGQTPRAHGQETLL